MTGAVAPLVILSNDGPFPHILLYLCKKLSLHIKKGLPHATENFAILCMHYTLETTLLCMEDFRPVFCNDDR